MKHEAPPCQPEIHVAPASQGLRPAWVREPLSGFLLAGVFASTYIAARFLSPWAVGFVSLGWVLGLCLAWTRWASRVNKSITYFSQLAWTDDLTQLGNDRIFRDRLNQIEEDRGPTGGSTVLILLDLDHFKNYNDAWGHLAGDEVLREVGDFLRTLTSRPLWPHRLGGDEFAILARGWTLGQGFDLAEQIRQAIGSRKWSGHAMTASLGLVAIEGTTLDSVRLRHLADQALYRSKRLGGNRVSTAQDLEFDTSI